MTDHAPVTARVCSNCDGFPTVRVTLGGRDRHGHLRTITVHCSACTGTGTVPARRLLTASAGRRA
jgi:hypothetical protein